MRSICNAAGGRAPPSTTGGRQTRLSDNVVERGPDVDDLNFFSSFFFFLSLPLEGRAVTSPPRGLRQGVHTKPPNKVLFFGATRCDNAAITPPGFALDTTLSVEAVASLPSGCCFFPPAEAKTGWDSIPSTNQNHRATRAGCKKVYAG